ncbi:MAG: transcriptional repressor [Verrucomicrobia bacterium]|jgi:Fur family peroxide stress response transcriptional regulator|nr:transcriptional repressor [Verrucomicrobiota bacterium]
MSLDSKASTSGELIEKLAHSGLRQTPQRQLVYQVLVENRDHPTAEEVFIRTKQKTPDISMATVYNCLDALVKCSVVKQVNLDRGATRYCPNMMDHSHFHCEQCSGVFDIDLTNPLEAAGARMPRGFLVKHLDLTLKGVCPACAQKHN